MKAKDGIANVMEAINGPELEPERLARLNDEQRAIVLKREEIRKARAELIKKLRESDDPDVHQYVFDHLRDIDGDTCEHDRSIWSPCAACYEIDQLMYPEMFDENGDPISDEE